MRLYELEDSTFNLSNRFVTKILVKDSGAGKETRGVQELAAPYNIPVERF